MRAATRFDDLYSSAGSFFVRAPTTGFTSDDIGTGFAASAKYLDHKYLVFQAGWAISPRAIGAGEDKQSSPRF
jgi:hypothetical protein